MVIPKVSDIINIIEQLYPLSLSEKWDNSGLQTGSKKKDVHNILIALDPLMSVVKSCKTLDIDLLITHHPLLMEQLKVIDYNTSAGSVIKMAASLDLSIYSAHTNVDKGSGGLNDIFGQKIGLKDMKPLIPSENRRAKFVVYVPIQFEKKVLSAIFSTNGVEIENYSNCTFRNRGVGTYKPNLSAKPFQGSAGKIEHADEIRIEVLVNLDDLNYLIDEIKKVHPYEVIAYDVYLLLLSGNGSHGIGRIGNLEEKTDFNTFARIIKEKFGLSHIKISGDPKMPVFSVVVCTGSGSSLTKDFIKSEADVYISGDIKYHDAQNILENRAGVIDIGHFNSEQFFIEHLSQKLNEIVIKSGFKVNIIPCNTEKDPFTIV